MPINDFPCSSDCSFSRLLTQHLRLLLQERQAETYNERVSQKRHTSGTPCERNFPVNRRPLGGFLRVGPRMK